MSLAVKSLMQHGEDLDRRVWFIIDELASLNPLPILLRGLSESRRFGGCFFLAFQDLNQLDVLYGLHIARTLGNLMNTKVVFRLDSYAAKQMAAPFGEHEVHDRNRSISFSVHEERVLKPNQVVVIKQRLKAGERKVDLVKAFKIVRETLRLYLKKG